MKVVIDTSVWVDYLRHSTEGGARALDGLLERGEALACGPVVAELLAGARAGDRAQLSGLLASLPWADLGRAQWRGGGEVAATLRALGAQVPLTDLAIAVAATEAGAGVWSRHSDFDRLPLALPAFCRYEP